MGQNNNDGFKVKDNFDDLCYACRTGDVENADRLISMGVNINQVDRFDNSPLFLASLCGHIELVKLLLERGAICDRDRHEGARCIYGALTDAIRDMLLSYDISKAFDTNQPFATHISSLLKEDELDTNDLLLGCKDDVEFSTHKFMLIARSPVFDISNPDKLSTPFKDIPSYTLGILLEFIYLIPILHEIRSTDFPDLIKLANTFQLKTLSEFLNKARHMTDPVQKSTLMIAYQYKFTELARNQLKNFVKNDIIGRHIDIADDSNILEIPDPAKSVPFPDIYLVVENHAGTKRIYPCHIAMLSRADFFKELVKSDFQDGRKYQMRRSSQAKSDDTTDILCLELPTCEFGVAESIINYLYYDRADIDPNYAFEVIRIADYIMASRLKNIAAAVITQSPDVLVSNTIFDVLRLAWETGVERLEQFGAKYIAQHIQGLSSSKELYDVILESSRRISSREELDTIELVADIRFYLLGKYDLEPEDISLLETDADDTEFLQSLGLLDYKDDMITLNKIVTDLGLSI